MVDAFLSPYKKWWRSAKGVIAGIKNGFLGDVQYEMNERYTTDTDQVELTQKQSMNTDIAVRSLSMKGEGMGAENLEIANRVMSKFKNQLMDKNLK